MYLYYYGVSKKHYKAKLRLLMTDTESLFDEIKAKDVYKDLFEEDSKYKKLFDASNFKKTNPYYSEVNKKVNG